MTAEKNRRAPAEARRRAAMARLLLTEDELRAEDAAEEADLRELAEADRAEVKAVSYGEGMARGAGRATR
jgi:hypothetical protein